MLKRNDSLLYDALIEKGLATQESLSPLLAEVESGTSSLAELVVSRGFFDEAEVLKVLAEKMHLTALSLKDASIDRAIIAKVPLKVASYYKFIPLGVKDGTLTIAVSSPLDVKTQDEIRTQLGYQIEMALAPQREVHEALAVYYGIAAETLEKIAAQTSPTSLAAHDLGSEKVEDIERLAEDASVIKLVNQIILEAYRKRATDIHIEPYRQKLSLRYRIDGLLYDANVPSEIKNYLSAIISRIKIMANLNIVERRLPQDGRAVVRVQDRLVDLRISTIPTPYGESVVIRILPTQMLINLSNLGLAERDRAIFEELVDRPHGIIFVTGPTGSGKTTTLYACLNKINTKERKIITIEDPIEYEMSGITQIQVMPEIGLDFARGLRSMLRHDPDVMMVGEVRDLETAEIAIRVALTGHLVLSTLHTNDAASGITRLVDIGLEPYLVASSVISFIAQRLIRVICPECKHEDKAAPEAVKEQIRLDLGLGSKDEVKIFRGKGCSHCNSTGYFGRTAIYEILLVDNEIKDIILKKAPANLIKRSAISKGMRTLRQDGWHKVIAGATTPEEVMKVTSAEETEPGRGPGGEEGAGMAMARPEEGLPGMNKRVYSRLDDKVNIRYKIFKNPEELKRRGLAPEQLSVTKNVSAGGVLFVANEPLTPGSFVELSIELFPGEEPIECLARVVRSDEAEEGKAYNIAVCFLDIASGDKALLARYVRSREEKK